MLNLGDALVTLAAFFSLLWLFWQFSEATALATKMMERQVGRHNFRRGWKTEVADSSGFYTLKQCARSGF